MSSAERLIARIVRTSELDPDELRSKFATFLWTGEGDFPHAAREDAHALGWLHQYLGEPSRREAFAAHTAREAKHDSATTTTQLYTPRWVADWLTAQCFELVPRPQTVLDPACGGGQMLLAAARAWIASGAEPAEAFSRLRGVDLDPNAVWACRESLKRAAANAVGHRCDALEAQIDDHVFVADGLTAALDSADIVLTNPPYMGLRSMPPDLKERLAEFAPFHQDLYLAFIKRCATLARRAIGILAPQTVWYLKRFERARAELLESGTLTHFAHLGHGIFDALSGEKATVVAFVWTTAQTQAATKFWDARDSGDPATALLDPPRELPASRFAALPAMPLAFWLPDQLIDAFDGPRLADIAEVPGSQNKTGDNARFVRPIDDAPPGWLPYSKGGKFAPWWGNWDWAVDWSDEARAFYGSNPTSNLLAERYWGREGLCYSDFGGRHFNARWMPPGCVFDMAGPAIFVEDDDRDLLAALLVVLNSTAARAVLNALNPTLHFQVRDVRNLPLPAWDDATIAAFAALGHELVARTRAALQSDGPPPLHLELEADRRVADAYGCPDLSTPRAFRRVHHRLQRLNER